MFCLEKKIVQITEWDEHSIFHQAPLTWVLLLGKCSSGVSDDGGVDKTGDPKGPRNVSEHYSHFVSGISP